ncbi:MAG TPA: isochorismatase family cysteine hydrolase, partial [Anaerolineae bacterium]|nr:isochorismatase family cysteine hydrolase [Anaerolineae bacterium]
MKSCYFTCETIDTRSLAMLQKLEKCIKIHKVIFIPERSALLILDMQQYFLDERSHAFIPSALPIIPRIKNLANAFHERNLPVVLTRHINSKEDAGCMAQWWKDLITEDNDLSEIISELHTPDSTVIKKTQYDGFNQTSLEN